MGNRVVALWGRVLFAVALVASFASSAMATDPTLLDNIVAAADLTDNITAGATAMAGFVALLTLAFIGFLIVRKAWKWIRGGLG